MAVSSAAAQQLCTKSELDLFTQSLSRNVKSLNETRLKSKVARSRKLRDKYRQLANRQDREARGKQPSKGSRPSRGSQRTRKKEQLFAESLARFEKQLGTMKSAQPATSKPVKKKAAGQNTVTQKKAASKKAASKKTASKKTASKKTASKKTASKKTPAKKTDSKQAAAARKPAKKRAAKKKTIPKRKVAARGGAGPRISGKSKKAATSAKRTRVKSSGRVRKTAHLSSQGRRKQIRRDSR